MKRIMNYEARIKNLFVVALFLFLTLNPAPSAPQVLALEPTQTATPSSEVQKKLKALQEDIASKAAVFKQEISKKLQNKFYLGFVKSKSNSSLTLATQSETRLVSLDEYTLYLGKNVGKKKFSLDTLSQEDYIAVLGDVDETEVLSAKKIVKITPEEFKKEIVWGEVTSVSSSTFTLQTKENQNITISTDPKTIYQVGKLKGSFTDLKEGKVVVVVNIVTKEQHKTRFVYLFSSSSNSPYISTPSAQATSSTQIKKTDD